MADRKPPTFHRRNLAQRGSIFGRVSSPNDERLLQQARIRAERSQSAGVRRTREPVNELHRHSIIQRELESMEDREVRCSQSPVSPVGFPSPGDEYSLLVLCGHCALEKNAAIVGLLPATLTKVAPVSNADVVRSSRSITSQCCMHVQKTLTRHHFMNGFALIRSCRHMVRFRRAQSARDPVRQRSLSPPREDPSGHHPDGVISGSRKNLIPSGRSVCRSTMLFYLFPLLSPTQILLLVTVRNQLRTGLCYPSIRLVPEIRGDHVRIGVLSARDLSLQVHAAKEWTTQLLTLSQESSEKTPGDRLAILK
eukprot:1194712-Prorocentrum_minimum.AAC.8